MNDPLDSNAKSPVGMQKLPINNPNEFLWKENLTVVYENGIE